MTLILTWLDKRKIVQVSDQRLTLPDGSLFDEQALKTICVRSCDCSFLLSYTGEAYMPQWSRTDYWLTAAIQPLTLRSLDDLIEGLCFRLNNDAAPKKRLCVVAAGYPHGSNIWFFFRISNFHGPRDLLLSEAADHFTARLRPALERPSKDSRGFDDTGVQLSGPVRKQAKRAGRHELPGMDGMTSAAKLAKFIREASKSPRYGLRIGLNCVGGVGAVLTPCGQFKTVYYPAHRSSRVITPHIVDTSAIYANISLKPAPDSASTMTDFVDWPELSARVERHGKCLISITNTGSIDWTDVRLDLNGRPDYKMLAEGFECGPGYIYGWPLLAAQSTTSVGLASSAKSVSATPFNPEKEDIEDLVLVARLNGRQYGKLIVGPL